MKIENLAPNQTIVTINDARFFSSYGTNIAKIENDETVLDDKFWNYSKTTSRYRTIFLAESTKETQKKIDSGVYRLVNLNA